jgi:hypothetical protein
LKHEDVLRQGVCKAANATSSPQVYPRMYIVAAGRLKVLPMKKRLENGHLRVVGYKRQTSSQIFRECHINFSRYFNLVLGMHVILTSFVQIFVADEPKNTRVIASFSSCHKVDMVDHN